MWEELGAWLGRRRLRPTGPCFTIHHDAEYKESEVDLEVCEPIDANVEGDDRVQVRVLSGGSMASVIHSGSYDLFDDAYAALMTWVEQNGYRIIGPDRMLYIRGPEHGVAPHAYVTEIQFPVEKS